LLDTTETKDSQLRDSEAILSATINTALDAIVQIDSAGTITRWNNQAEMIFGWQRVEVIGRMLHETIIPPQYRAAHIDGMKHFLAIGEGPILSKRIEMNSRLNCLSRLSNIQASMSSAPFSVISPSASRPNKICVKARSDSGNCLRISTKFSG
jgi:PAS domain-containing protein